MADVTRDAFFGGRLIVTQPKTGHRSGTDAVLLAAAVPRGFSGRVYDAGAGVGAVGLGVALFCPDAAVTLIENDPFSVALAAVNVADNSLGARVTPVACDLLSRGDRCALLAVPADLVVTNPPFYVSDRVRASPDAAQRAAHVLAPGVDLEDWLRACLACLHAKGTLIMIHHAACVPEMLRALNSQLGGLTLMPIQARAGQSAGRVLLRGKKGSRGPFQLTPPLVLHEGNSFTAHATALHTGDESLDW